MPRWFVNVNTRNKKIVFHTENSKPCPHICKHIRIGGAYTGKFKIGRGKQYKTIRIEGKGNDYWLIIWAKTIKEAIKHPRLKKVINEEGIAGQLPICTKCQ